MANLLWGKVYYQDKFAGYLREDASGDVTFTYDNYYIESGYPAIAYTLPVQAEPYISYHCLPAFFDNLVSEGWLERVQSHLLGKREATRFELLLAFGRDCAGAVSIIDPEPTDLTKAILDMADSKEMVVQTSRASLSGVQPKLAVIEDNNSFRPAQINELSTHIAKFPSANHPNIIENELLTTLAYQALLPDDDTAELIIDAVEGINESALIIKRFDRENNQRIHFEEFNQLLNRQSKEKYSGAYKDMADFIHQVEGCLPVQIYLLYRRILAGLILGNTDMHLKNFAMLHTQAGLRLTPAYDQVAASLYNYKSLALAIGNVNDRLMGSLKARHLVILGEEFGLSKGMIHVAVQSLERNIEAAKDAIAQAPIAEDALKKELIQLIGKRWNGTYALIGKTLLKKP